MEEQGACAKLLGRTGVMAEALARAAQHAVELGYDLSAGEWDDGKWVNGVEFRVDGETLFWIRERGGSTPEVFFFKPGVDRSLRRI